jgi:hypothetical protein
MSQYRRSLPPPADAGDRQHRRSWDLVMTTLPRGILPSTLDADRGATASDDHPR